MVKGLKQRQVATQRPVRSDATPRLPHERDESDDSQESPPRADMQQAASDIERGLVDTDLHNTPGVEAVKNNTPVAPGQPPGGTRGKE
jgi:hypothetical protein